MDLRRAVRDKEKFKTWLSGHGDNIKAWIAFAAVVLFVFFVFSDGDYSFILTLSSIVGLFSFLMVIYKIESSKSCGGVSLKMIELYVIVLFVRLCSIIPFEG